MHSGMTIEGDRRKMAFRRAKRVSMAYRMLRILWFPVSMLGLGMTYLVPNHIFGLASQWIMVVVLTLAVFALWIYRRHLINVARATPPGRVR